MTGQLEKDERKENRKIDKNYFLSGILLVAVIVAVVMVWSFYAKNENLPTLSFKLPGSLPQASYQFAIGGTARDGNYGFAEPMGVGLAETGDIYVADSMNHQVKVYNRKGQFITSFGDQDTLGTPLDVEIYKEKVYVVDNKKSRIQIFDLRGKFIKTLTGPEIGEKIGAWLPVALHVDTNGDIYVTDVFYHRVVVLNQEGAVKKHFGAAGTGVGQMMYPNGVAVDGKWVYVADSNNGRIQVFDKEGKFKETLKQKDQAVGFNMPRGLAMGKDGLLFVAETFSHGFGMVEIEDGRISQMTRSGSRGTGDGEMNFPNDVAVQGYLLCVADRANDRILVYKIE